MQFFCLFSCCANWKPLISPYLDSWLARLAVKAGFFASPVWLALLVSRRVFHCIQTNSRTQTFHNHSFNTFLILRYVYIFLLSYKIKQTPPFFNEAFWILFSFHTILWIREWMELAVQISLCIFFKGCTWGHSGVFDEPVQLPSVCTVSGRAGGQVAL